MATIGENSCRSNYCPGLMLTSNTLPNLDYFDNLNNCCCSCCCSLTNVGSSSISFCKCNNTSNNTNTNNNGDNNNNLLNNNNSNQSNCFNNNNNNSIDNNVNFRANSCQNNIRRNRFNWLSSSTCCLLPSKRNITIFLIVFILIWSTILVSRSFREQQTATNMIELFTLHNDIAQFVISAGNEMCKLILNIKLLCH